MAYPTNEQMRKVIDEHFVNRSFTWGIDPAKPGSECTAIGRYAGYGEGRLPGCAAQQTTNQSPPNLHEQLRQQIEDANYKRLIADIESRPQVMGIFPIVQPEWLIDAATYPIVKAPLPQVTAEQCQLPKQSEPDRLWDLVVLAARASRYGE